MKPQTEPGGADIRMRGFRERAEVAAVVQLVERRVHALPAEDVQIVHAARRVLALDVIADVQVPSFDRAAMDGFALHGSETFGADTYNALPFEVVGEAF